MRGVPILRSGVLAQDFCARVALARVEAVFARSLYLRAGDSFVCIGAPAIGNGPVTLTANLGSPSDLGVRPGMAASVHDRHITIGTAVQFTLDQSESWRALAWPACLRPARLVDICETLKRRATVDAPEEGLARYLAESPGPRSLLAGAARTRVAGFEYSLLEGRHDALANAARGLIGLGPGLTPSGDDFLSGALAALDAMGESRTHAVLARAVCDTSSATSPLSACLLRAVAAGHVGEHLHCMVASVATGDIDAALTAANAVGHSSGWDMLAGVVSTLRAVAMARVHYAPAA